MLFYLLLIVFPLVRSLAFSFFKVDILGGDATYQFVGLDNYRAVIDDDVFWRSARNTLVWAIASPFLEIPVGLLLALYLQRGTQLTKFMRVLWFMPVLLPQIVVGIIWAWIYNSEWGALNQILNTIGLDSWMRAWLGHPDTALPALIVVTTWTWIGFNMIILLAAVSSIPKDLIEAARLDGARRVQILMRRHRSADQAGDRQPDDSLLHRQDEGVRPDLGDDAGRSAVVDRNGGDLHRQAGVLLEHL